MVEQVGLAVTPAAHDLGVNDEQFISFSVEKTDGVVGRGVTKRGVEGGGGNEGV